MTTCLGKRCSFGLLCLFFVNVYQFVYFSPFGFEAGVWNSVVLSSDNCISFFLVHM